MIVVSDTTAISNLYQIEHLELLHLLFDGVIISPGVQRELYRVNDQAIHLDSIDWIKVKYPTNQHLIADLLNNLDLGEAESIALAVEIEADYLIIDEKEGRKFAEKHGVKIVGILGILIQAKQKNLIDQVRPAILKLREIGFWIKPSLANRVLGALEEEPIE